MRGRGGAEGGKEAGWRGREGWREWREEEEDPKSV